MEVVLGIMLGVAYVVPPGPINIETMRHGLARGWRHAFAVQLGAILGDLAYAVLAWAGVDLVLAHAGMHPLVQMGSVVVLVYLGWSALRSCRDVGDLGAGSAAGAPSFLTGVALSFNPYAITFWLSVGETLVSPQRPAVVVGFFLACLLWALIIALLVGKWRAHISERFVRLASWGCGLALIVSGLGLGCVTALD